MYSVKFMLLISFVKDHFWLIHLGIGLHAICNINIVLIRLYICDLIVSFLLPFHRLLRRVDYRLDQLFIDFIPHRAIDFTWQGKSYLSFNKSGSNVPEKKLYTECCTTHGKLTLLWSSYIFFWLGNVSLNPYFTAIGWACPLFSRALVTSNFLVRHKVFVCMWLLILSEFHQWLAFLELLGACILT